MKKTALTLTLVAVLATPAVLAQQSTTYSGSQQQNKLDRKTTKFIQQAAEDGRMEVSMAELGLSKAQNAQLKSFCETLKTDHQQANDKLMQIAQTQGVQIDQTTPRKEKRELAKFEKLSGAEFDKEFATQALKDHQKDIASFEKASQDIQNAEVKQFIQETLPKLRQHLQHAAQVAQAVGVEQSTISSVMKKANESVGGTSDSSSSGTGGAGSKVDKDDHSQHGSNSTVR